MDAWVSKRLNGRTTLYSVIVLQESAAKKLSFSLLWRKESGQQTVERPAINSAIVSVNLRPLKKKIFKDPVVITLRHSVVSRLPIKRPTPISAYICNPLQLSVTYLKAPSKFDSENCVVHHDNISIEFLMPEHFCARFRNPAHLWHQVTFED